MINNQEPGSNKSESNLINSDSVMTFKQEALALFSGIRQGRMGSLPAIIGFFILVILFSFLSPVFLTQLNFANLLQQSSPLIILALGLVFILLIAEIDLSAGVTSGLVSALFVVTLKNFGIPWWLAVILSIFVGVTVGLAIGILVAKVGIPSFIVTLAAFLAFQGLQIMVVGQGGLYRIETPAILSLENGNLSVTWGWILGALLVGFVLINGVLSRRRRSKNGHQNRAVSILYFKVISISVLIFTSIYILNMERGSNPEFKIKGVPIAVLVVLFVLIPSNYLLNKTTFGIHVYAVGGNPEAARRAGIKVGSLKIIIFMIGSGLASISGLMAASRVGTVDASAGRTVVLSGVAAAVVGGVSLFGGRGRLNDAVVGGLVIAVIDNGLGLLSLPSGLNLAVTGGVLLIAATADALSRKHGTINSR
jgi:D-xylose transport system permease protein